MILTKVELQSATWIKLQEYIEEQIEALRLKNDASLDERETARLRGQIAALKNLLAAVQPPPAIAVDDL